MNTQHIGTKEGARRLFDQIRAHAMASSLTLAEMDADGASDYLKARMKAHILKQKSDLVSLWVQEIVCCPDAPTHVRRQAISIQQYASQQYAKAKEEAGLS